MSNEKRVRQNFIGGLVDTADLAAGGTTLNSAGLVAIATTIDATNHMPITLDPDGIYGAPEIAYITALTVSATSSTLLRGQEGTTARQHLLDTPWVHGPTTRDFVKSAKAVHNSGDVTVSSTSYAAVDTALDLSVAAWPGDILEMAVSGMWGGTNTPVFVYGVLDAATWVSGAAVNYFSTEGSASATYGVPSWLAQISSSGSSVGATDAVIGSSRQLRVASGDIVNSRVTVRLLTKLSAAGSRTLFGQAGLPLQVHLKNLGPQEA